MSAVAFICREKHVLVEATIERFPNTRQLLCLHRLLLRKTHHDHRKMKRTTTMSDVLCVNKLADGARPPSLHSCMNRDAGARPQPPRQRRVGCARSYFYGGAHANLGGGHDVLVAQRLKDSWRAKLRHEQHAATGVAHSRYVVWRNKLGVAVIHGAARLL